MSENSLLKLTAPVRADVTQVCKMLSDASRLHIVLRLGELGEADVTSLCEGLDILQPAVSHHLSLLRLASVIQVRREGKHKFYSLNTARLQSILLAVLRCAGPDSRELRFGNFLFRLEGEAAEPAAKASSDSLMHDSID